MWGQSNAYELRGLIEAGGFGRKRPVSHALRGLGWC